MNIPDLCRLARKEKNLSLIHLSQLSGISYSMLYRLEEGDIPKPHPDLLRKLAEPLNLAYETLLEMAGYLPSLQCTSTADSPDNPDSSHRVPVYSWDSVSDLSPPSCFQLPLHSNQWILFSSHPYPLFATPITTSSFLPVFRPHDCLIVQVLPTHLHAPNRYILYKHGQQLTLGKTCLYRHQLVIQPLHPEPYNMLAFDDVILYGFLHCLYFGSINT